MHTSNRRGVLAAFVYVFFSAIILSASIQAQTASNSGTIYGTVTDPAGAVVAGATVTIENPVSQYRRQVKTGSDGQYQLTNVPFNPYHLTIFANGFSTDSEDVDVRS